MNNPQYYGKYYEIYYNLTVKRNFHQEKMYKHLFYYKSLKAQRPRHAYVKVI